MPAADHAQSKGLTLGAWGVLTGSEIAAELYVRVRAAAELPPQWLKSLTQTPDIPAIIYAEESQVRLPAPTPPAELPEPVERSPHSETNTSQTTKPARASDVAPKKSSKQSGGFMWMLGAIIAFIILVAVLGT